MTRLEIGQEAPMFSLPSVEYEEVCLTDYEDVPVVLVLPPGEGPDDWSRQLDGLREDYDRLRPTHVPVLVIIAATVEELRDYWEKKELPFVGLSDPGREVLEAYGQGFLASEGWLPAVVALDAEHKVAYARYGSDASDVASSQEIVDVMSGLAEAA